MSFVEGAYKDNVILLSEGKKREFLYVNKLVEQQALTGQYDDEKDNLKKKYFLFKRFLEENKDYGSIYDPSDCMIAETIAYIMLGTMKLLRAKTMFHDKVKRNINQYHLATYYPVKHVIRELSKNMRTFQGIQTMMFSINFEPDYEFDSPEFEELIEALADERLGGADFNGQSDIEDSLLRKVTGFSVIMATLKSHSQRKQFWRKKLMTVLKNSEPQWLLDQFHYCKLFLLGNSFDMSRDEIQENVTKTNPYLESIFTDGKEPEEGLKAAINKSGYDEAELPEDESGEMKVINLTSMVGNMVGYEAKIRAICKAEMNPKTGKVSSKLIADLEKESRLKMKRFLTSNFELTMEACKKFQSA